MSLIITNSNTSTAVTAGGIVPLGVAVHGCGKDIRLVGNGIALYGCGYYNIDVSISASVTGTGAMTAQLYADGVPVPGAIASETPGSSDPVVNLTIPWIYRKGCGCRATVLTVVLDSAGTVENSVVRVTK